MRKILALTTVSAILMFGFIGQAADDRFRFKVDVSVTCDDENIKSAVESYIKRELRALRDVDIVPKFDDKTFLLNEDATYFLNMVVVEDETIGGRKLGYDIAYCYYSRVARPPRFDPILGMRVIM